MGAPELRYARDGERHLAYQVVSDSGPDVLLAPSAAFPIDLLWDEPTVVRHLNRLASFSRLILTDHLGAGSSDAISVDSNPAMQSWMDGLLAVLDAVGSERAAVFGMHGACLPAVMLAASHPHRVRSLLLWNGYARLAAGPSQPFGIPESLVPRYLEALRDVIATRSTIDVVAPSWAGDPAKRRWWRRGECLSGGPGYWKAGMDLFIRTDVAPLLDSIQAPTLVMRRRGDRDIRREHAVHLAERIPNARLVEFDGDDSVWFVGDADPVLDEIESFVTGMRTAQPTNRVLSTVLFTDIVGSTQHAATLGDEAWAAVLVAHDRLVERHVAAARGVVVKSTGDGVLATFDGPARAIECACALRDSVDDLGLSIRAGLHTGEVELGGGDVHGIAVHIAARIMALAGPGEVFVSGVIPPLVLGSRLTFTDRGEHELKGVPGSWAVLGVDD
jgi:class 3 adenylate cyclase